MISAWVACCSYLQAQNRSIEFQYLSFKEVLAKARETNREIFVDCYTSWCGPCKQMAREVFTIDSVADYFNTRFINVKYDLEKEERELVQKYGISGYPTFLILDGNGKELRRLSGYHTADKWMEMIRGKEKGASLAELEERYKSGERLPAFILEYMEALRNMNQYKESEKVFADMQLYRTAEDISDRTRWQLFCKYQHSLDATDSQFLINHTSLFRDRIGGNEVDEQLDVLYFFKVTNFAYWEQQAPGKPFEMRLLDSVICQIRMLDFDKSVNTLAFLMTEKKMREKKYEEAIGFLRVVREVRLWNSTYYLQYYNTYADRILGLKPSKSVLRLLNAEYEQMVTLYPDERTLWQKRHQLCKLLKDKEGQIECERKCF